MSLVEKALEKMRTASPEAVPPPTASIVPRAAAGAARRAANPPVSPSRVISFDRPALCAAGLLAPEGHEYRLLQQYRHIKRPLISAAAGRGEARLPNGYLIMVASALPGEGKTFTSLNLALSMARERDIDVLLVDADVAKRHISRMLNVAGEPGLLDLLRDPTMDTERCVLKTEIPSLSILPAGENSADATELFASSRMEDVGRALGGRDMHRIVLFDSPPLLATTESHALAHVAGQVLIVVRAETTPQHELLAALRNLGDRPGVTLVLNQSVWHSSREYDYYYYGPGGGAEGHERSTPPLRVP